MLHRKLVKRTVPLASHESTGDFYPKLAKVVFAQIITGMIMTMTSLARFIGLLPPVESIDEA